jgi:uncharacterized membrane protein YhaH (DUF805 family)
MDWKNLLFSGNGRIGRQEFWVGFLILLGVGVVLNFIPVIGGLIGLVTIWCWVVLYAKRLHDMGKSGWLQLIPYGVGAAAIIGAFVTGGMAIIAAAAQGDNVDPTTMIAGLGGAALFLGGACLVSLIFLLWVGLSGGQAGDNQYGPPPGTPAPEPATAEI